MWHTSLVSTEAHARPNEPVTKPAVPKRASQLLKLPLAVRSAGCGSGCTTSSIEYTAGTPHGGGARVPPGGPRGKPCSVRSERRTAASRGSREVHVRSDTRTQLGSARPPEAPATATCTPSRMQASVMAHLGGDGWELGWSWVGAGWELGGSWGGSWAGAGRGLGWSWVGAGVGAYDVLLNVGVNCVEHGKATRRAGAARSLPCRRCGGRLAGEHGVALVQREPLLAHVHAAIWVDLRHTLRLGRKQARCDRCGWPALLYGPSG